MGFRNKTHGKYPTSQTHYLHLPGSLLDRKPCISYSSAYIKYLNKYALTTNVSAYVTYVNTFACQNYLCKIVVLCISFSHSRKWICGVKIPYPNSSDTQMY
jgi:hypothetical protein